MRGRREMGYWGCAGGKQVGEGLPVGARGVAVL